MKRFLSRIATFLCIVLISIAGLFCPGATGVSQTIATKPPPRQMENLGRGVVALNEGGGKIFVSWRLLGTDPDDIAFNLYRATDDAEPIKINGAPITESTNYVDTGVDTTKSNAYFVRPIVVGIEKEMSKSFVNKITPMPRCANTLKSP